MIYYEQLFDLHTYLIYLYTCICLEFVGVKKIVMVRI